MPHLGLSTRQSIIVLCSLTCVNVMYGQKKLLRKGLRAQLICESKDQVLRDPFDIMST